ncbi:hypothetical protein ACTFIY_004840 [Dictyostelium cf. discoideum]
MMEHKVEKICKEFEEDFKKKVISVEEQFTKRNIKFLEIKTEIEEKNKRLIEMGECVLRNGDLNNPGSLNESVHTLPKANRVLSYSIKKMKNFKDDIYQNVIGRIESNKIILKESNNLYNEIQSQFKDNQYLLTNELKKLHFYISIIKLVIKRQLEKTFDDNTLINTIITSTINNKKEILSKIINNNHNDNDVDNGQTVIEILNEIIIKNNQQLDRDTFKIIKQYQQSLIVLNNHNSNKLKEYKNQIIHFNCQIIDDIKNKLKSIYTFNDINIYKNNRYEIEIDENNNEFIKLIFKLKEGCSIAFTDDCNILSKLKDKLPLSVMLLDGFKQKLTPGILPECVKSLYLGDIKQELMIGSIPNLRSFQPPRGEGGNFSF